MSETTVFPTDPFLMTKLRGIFSASIAASSGLTCVLFLRRLFPMAPPDGREPSLGCPMLGFFSLFAPAESPSVSSVSQA
mgnify:CR=1 FL=1